MKSYEIIDKDTLKVTDNTPVVELKSRLSIESKITRFKNMGTNIQEQLDEAKMELDILDGEIIP